MKKLTWNQVWCMYDHAIAWIEKKDVDYDEEPDYLDMVGATTNSEGARVYSK